jgi:hypothetical protein
VYPPSLGSTRSTNPTQRPFRFVPFLLFRFHLVCNFADDIITTWDASIDRLVGWVSDATGREYAAADARWGTADATVVSLELLTVLGAGPLAAFIVYQIVKRDPARHYWIVVLSTAEIYGGYVSFFFLVGWGVNPGWQMMVMMSGRSADRPFSFFLWIAG